MRVRVRVRFRVRVRRGVENWYRVGREGQRSDMGQISLVSGGASSRRSLLV